MNIGIKWADWMSETEQSDLRDMAERVSNQNKLAQDARDDAYKSLGFWDRQTTNAIEDGRITRGEAIQMYHRLSAKIACVCMDTIPAPEE